MVLVSLIQGEPMAPGANRTGWLAGCTTLGGGMGWNLQFRITHLSIAFLQPGIQEAENVLYLQEWKPQQGNQRSSCGTKRRGGNGGTL